MKTIYVANDGEQFENKEECIEYEKDQEKKYNLSEVIILNKKGEVLKTRNRAECYSACADAHYILVKSEEDYKKIQTINREAGYSDIFPRYNEKYEGKENVYAYEYMNRDCEWVDLNFLLQKVKEDIVDIKFLFDTAK